MVLEDVIRKSCRKAPLERDALPRCNSDDLGLDRGYQCRQQLRAVPKSEILCRVSGSSSNAWQKHGPATLCQVAAVQLPKHKSMPSEREGLAWLGPFLPLQPVLACC